MAKPDIALDIEAVGARGDGLASFDGERLYVPGTLAGERVRVRLSRQPKKGLQARLVAIETPSHHRVAPPCRHFGDCGGCALQHMDEDSYRTWKLDLLLAALARQEVGHPEPEPLTVSPPGSRRRADLTALRRRGDVLLGFNARGSHRIFDLEECPVMRPSLVALVPPLRDLLSTVLDEGVRADVILTETASGIELVLVGTMELGRNRRERLVAFADDHDLARVARGHPRQSGYEPIVERRPVQMNFGGIPVSLPPAAFLQATAEGEVALSRVVEKAARGTRRIADLYAGAGTFTFPLAAGGAQVHAVEGGRALVRALKAAADASRLNRVTTEERDLDRRPLGPDQLDRYDLVVFDPPRAGARAQVERLVESAVPRIVAVSCNPASFARDAAFLQAGGYDMTRLVPVDQFLWSPHLELAAVFEWDAG